jgi:hypothetical protein
MCPSNPFSSNPFSRRLHSLFSSLFSNLLLHLLPLLHLRKRVFPLQCARIVVVNSNPALHSAKIVVHPNSKNVYCS